MSKTSRQPHLWVMPHRQNQYRPHATRSAWLLVAFLLLFAAPLLQNVVQTGGVLGRSADISTEALLQSTNRTRTDQQVPILSQNPKLSLAAEQKAADMFANQYWAHTSPDGVEPWVWVQKAEYHYAVAGENLARDFSTADAVLTAWMNSPDHRDNVLNERFRDVGFAVANGEFDGKPTTIVVAMYGSERTTISQAAGQVFMQPAALPTQYGSLSMAARMGVGLQSLTPTALVSVFLLLLLSVVSLVAHAYRKKLPPGIRQSWRKHHGLYKACLAVGLAGLTVLMYGGGQI